MSSNEHPSVYLTHKGTSGYLVLTREWPVVITSVISSVNQAVFGINDDLDKFNEGKVIIGELGKLRHELQHDRRLLPIPDDGQPDVSQYNESLGDVTWTQIPFLQAEFHFFRRIHAIFSTSKQWTDYDAFANRKAAGLSASAPAISTSIASLRASLKELELSETSLDLPQQPASAERTLFGSICVVSFFPSTFSTTYLVDKKSDNLEARCQIDHRFLTDESANAYVALEQARKNAKGDRNICIATSGAGYELAADLLLAIFLLQRDLATKVTLYLKAIQLNLDATMSDYDRLLRFLARDAPLPSIVANPPAVHQDDNFRWLAAEASTWRGAGKLVLVPSEAWHAPHSYWHLESFYPQLYSEMQKAELVIFHGDFHYRRLLSDAAWPPQTSFQSALGPLGKDSGIRILALRPIKSDILVECESDDVEAILGKEGPTWKQGGKYGVIQFSDGKT